MVTEKNNNINLRKNRSVVICQNKHVQSFSSRAIKENREHALDLSLVISLMYFFFGPIATCLIVLSLTVIIFIRANGCVEYHLIAFILEKIF